jgi:hypothetical protein
MRTGILAGSLLVGLALIATPLQAQRVSAEVVLRGGPVAGHVVVEDRESAYRHREVYRREPGRRMVAAYQPRVIVVERFDHRHGKHWNRGRHLGHGYRLVTVYYMDGRYYDRYDSHYSQVREVVVYERDGRFYQVD